MYLAIYLSIYLSIYPSIHPSIYLSVYFCPSICLSIYLPIYLSTYLSTYLCIYLSISIYLYLSLSISIYLYLSLSISIYLYLSLSIYLSIYLIYLSIYLSIYLYIYIYISWPWLWHCLCDVLSGAAGCAVWSHLGCFKDPWSFWFYPKYGWFRRESPIKLDDSGVPPFMETPIYIYTHLVCICISFHIFHHTHRLTINLTINTLQVPCFADQSPVVAAQWHPLPWRWSSPGAAHRACSLLETGDISW